MEVGVEVVLLLQGALEGQVVTLKPPDRGLEEQVGQVGREGRVERVERAGRGAQEEPRGQQGGQLRPVSPGPVAPAPVSVVPAVFVVPALEQRVHFALDLEAR